MDYSFGAEIQRFVSQVDSIASTSPMMILIAYSARVVSAERLLLYLEDNALVTQGDAGDEISNDWELEHIFRHRYLAKELEKARVATETIPRSFIVSLVSQFDTFLGRLVRTMFFVKPEMLSTSDKNISLSQLVQFNSVRDAQEYIIEKEVETLLRKSHVEQFAWLEAALSIPLKKDLDAWPLFVELTERRNLFVHADGVVSSQYLATCKQHGVSLASDTVVGTQLGVTPTYLTQSYETLYEIGVKLAHVMWRKLQPEDLEGADSNLNSLCYDLIKSKQYSLALKLLRFATETLKKHSSERSRLMFIINKAQAYKWDGQEDLALQTISNVDWSACSNDFQLVSAVLRNDYDAAAEIMKNIGLSRDLPKDYYREWPIFKEFRRTDQFKNAFEAIFHEGYKAIEIAPIDERVLTKLKEELAVALEKSKQIEAEAEASMSQDA